MSGTDPVLRLPQAELGALQDRQIRAMVELCYRSHPFYRALMRRERIEPRHVQTREDLARLPPSSKTDFLADPDAFRIDPADLSAEEGTLWKIIYTTGTTTGRPAPVYVTTHDHYAYMHVFAKRRELFGLTESDLIANLFPLTTFPLGAYSRAPDEAASIGAAMFIANTGRMDPVFHVHNGLDASVHAVARHRATVLWGVAGFVRRTLIRAQEMGADFGSVRMVMTTGEASSAAMREDMRRRMREMGCADTLIVNRYGSTEQGGSMVECQEGSGFHSVAPDHLFHEVIEPDSFRRLPDGEPGMLAFSHLNRRGTVFLRYIVGDVVTLSHATCPHCGRTSPRLTSQPTRTGSILKIKGTLVNLQNLSEEFDRLPELDEYQIVVRPLDAGDPFSMDELLVRVAVSRSAAGDMADRIAAKTLELTNVSPRIERVERNEIFDPITAPKPRRIIDQRPPR
jgi:phenylacetate-CoA ligase